MAERYPGSLFIVAAPSGGGKTSLVKKLVSALDNIEISISHTTRQKRPGEQSGVDYFFVSEEEFKDMIDAGAFVEYARVFGQYYGTSVEQIQDRLQAGIDVVLDIDWQGAQQIKQQFKNAVGIFVIPPSLDTLKQRLTSRRQDDEEVIQKRMQSAKDEMSHYHEFDYLIINDDFEKAAHQLQSIVTAHRLRMQRQRIEQKQLLSFLLSSQ
ncbi:guanylate kinase [Legionella londiniensis]|uniref:Guanylate kinase n=1 Tax=Legionella londiniensis TaxID=45068 RepID=A0A0W0VQZ1_9GAMM|nr:guanylate kinase [Legionella londiniensis]KTD22603.1 guanylate kinase [Legionella londiniensis]STX92534.1 guanylate kinase [Legionella londiniensis]